MTLAGIKVQCLSVKISGSYSTAVLLMEEGRSSPFLFLSAVTHPRRPFVHKYPSSVFSHVTGGGRRKICFCGLVTGYNSVFLDFMFKLGIFVVNRYAVCIRLAHGLILPKILDCIFQSVLLPIKPV